MITKTYDSKDLIDGLLEKIEPMIFIAEIVEKKQRDDLNKEIVMAMMASSLAIEDGIQQWTKSNLWALGRRVERTHNREAKLSATNILILLSDHDCYAKESMNDEAKEPEQAHVAYMAYSKTGPDDKKRKRPSGSGQKDYQDKKGDASSSSETATIETLFRSIVDMNATLGQLSSIVQTLQENQNSYRGRNFRNDRFAQGKNLKDGNDRARSDKQYAHKADPKKQKGKKR